MIDPALSAKEWATPHAERLTFFACVMDGGITFGDGSVAPKIGIHVEREDVPAIMALANAALPDDDPRKITRARMQAVRAALAEQFVDLSEDQWTSDATKELTVLLAALESYLPPEAG